MLATSNFSYQIVKTIEIDVNNQVKSISFYCHQGSRLHSETRNLWHRPVAFATTRTLESKAKGSWRISKRRQIRLSRGKPTGKVSWKHKHQKGVYSPPFHIQETGERKKIRYPDIIESLKTCDLSTGIWTNLRNSRILEAHYGLDRPKMFVKETVKHES